MKKKFNTLSTSTFAKSAGLLVGGTASAQIITLGALPFLTRIYSPDDFSTLAVFISISTLIAVVACLRLEVAIPLSIDEKEAINLLGLSLLSAFSVATLTLIIVFAWGDTILASISQSNLKKFSYFLPISVWLTASYIALQHWSLRKKRFRIIALTRFSQAISSVGSQATIGLFVSGPLGLIIGQILMSAAGIGRLSYTTTANDRKLLKLISYEGLRGALRKNIKYPKFSVLETLFHHGAFHIPLLIVATLAVGPEAGFIFLTTRLIGAPVELIGKAVGQVYLSEASQALREGRLKEYTEKVMIGLARVGIPPLIFIAVIAPTLFEFAFGVEWGRAGVLFIWMTPWFIFKLLSSPGPMLMYVKVMQERLLLLMLAGFSLRVVITYSTYLINPLFIAEGYAISGCAFFMLTTFYYVRLSGLGINFLLKMFYATYLPITFSVLCGLLIKFLILV